MKRLLSLILILCMLMQGMTLGAMAENTANLSMDAFLAENMDNLGLSDYKTLYTKAFSTAERTKIAEVISASDTVATDFLLAVEEIVVPDSESVDVLLFEDFEKESPDMNGQAPTVGGGTWARTVVSDTSSVVHGGKALSGTKSLLTVGATGNGATSYATDADSYIVTYYIYDSLTQNGNSNVTFDLAGTSNFIVGFDLSAQFNAAWQGRGGNATNVVLTDEQGNAILRQKGWNKLTYFVDSQQGTSVFINGTKAYFGGGSTLQTITEATGVAIRQRSGWFLSGVKNEVYIDAVSIVKAKKPSLSSIEIVQSEENAMFTAVPQGYTDPLQRDPIYQSLWYVEENGAFVQVATVDGLSYTPTAADAGKTFRVEVQSMNDYGIQSNMVTAEVEETVLDHLEKPSVSLVALTGDARVGGRLCVEYSYQGQKEGQSQYIWYMDGQRIYSLSEKEITVPVSFLEKDITCEVIPYDIHGLSGVGVRSEKVHIQGNTTALFSSIETEKQAEFLLKTYAEVLGIREAFAALSDTQKFNLYAYWKKNHSFSSQADIVASFNSYTNSSQSHQMSEIEALRRKYYTFLTGDDAKESYPEEMLYIAWQTDREVEKILSQIVPPGTAPLKRAQVFADLKVARSDLGSRHMTKVFERAVIMARAYSDPYSIYFNDRDLLAQIISVLEWVTYAKGPEGLGWYNAEAWDFYYDRNNPMAPVPFSKANWWNLEHGTPKEIVVLVGLIFDELDTYAPKLKADMLKAVDTFIPNPAYCSGGMAGGNGALTIFVVALNTILRGNPPMTAEQLSHPRYTNPEKTDKLKACKNRFEAQVTYASWNGFHPDGSYVDHNYYAYTGAYGAVIIGYLARLMYLFEGTPYALSAEKTALVYDWIFDSIEPMIYKENLMDFVRGRCVSSAGTGDDCMNFTKAFSCYVIDVAMVAEGATKKRLLSMVKEWATCVQDAIGMDLVISKKPSTVFYKNEVVNILKLLDDESVTPRGTLNISRVFPTMCRIVHFRDDYGIGLALYNKKIGSHEDGGDFSNGWHTGEGTIFLYNEDFNQYNIDYWPTINAYRMSGTTVNKNSGKSGVNGSNHAGGATIDKYTAAAFELAHPSNTLKAKKSYFLFDEEVVMLGSGISSSDGAVVETVVENRKIDTKNTRKLTVDGEEVFSKVGDSGNLSSVSWAHLSGETQKGDIGYYFPTGANLSAERYEGSGKWSDITKLNAPLEAEDTLRKQKYVSLWYDHGVNPTGGTYSYALLPGKTSEEMAAYANEPSYVVLANNDKVHGVYHKTLDILAANFWTDTEAEVGMFKANKKASVIMQNKNGIMTVGVSDPTQENTGKIRLTIAGVNTVISKDYRVSVVECTGDSITLDVNVADTKGQTVRFVLSDGATEAEDLPLWYDFEDEKPHASVSTNSENAGAQVTVIPDADTKGLKLFANKGSGVISYDFEDDTTLKDFMNDGKPDLKTSTGKAHSGTKSIVFPGGETTAGKLSVPESSYVAEVWIYDPGTAHRATAMLGVGNTSYNLIVGLYGSLNGSHYAYRSSADGNTWRASSVARTAGWHKITVDTSSGSSAKVYIDNKLIYTQSGMGSINAVTLLDYWANGNTAAAYADDLKLTTTKIPTPVVSADYHMPFMMLRGDYTVSADFYTTYNGNTPIYPIDIYANQEKSLVSIGVAGENIVLKTSTGIEVLAPKAEGKNTVSVQMDTNLKMFLPVVNGVALPSRAFYDAVNFMGGIKSVVSADGAEVYMDNVRLFASEEAVSLPLVYDFETGTLEKEIAYVKGDAQAAVEKTPQKDNYGLKITTQKGFQNIVYDFEGGSPLADFSVLDKNALTVASGQATSGTKSVVFKAGAAPSAGQVSIPLGQYVVKMKLYDPGASTIATAFAAVGNGEASLSTGLYGAMNKDNYLFRVGSTWTVTSVARTKGWHTLQITTSKDAGTNVYMDGVWIGARADLTAIHTVTIADYWANGNTADSYIDDLSITNMEKSEDVLIMQYAMPFLNLRGDITVESEIFTTYDGEQAIYPFTVFGGNTALLAAGYENGNVVIKTETGTKILADKSKQTVFRAKINTQKGVFTLYVNDVAVVRNRSLPQNADSITGIGYTGNAQAALYIDHLSVSYTPEPGVCIIDRLPECRVCITKNPKYEKEYTVIFASYDADGRLVSAASYKKADMAEEEILEADIGTKILVWEDKNGGVPLMDAWD